MFRHQLVIAGALLGLAASGSASADCQLVPATIDAIKVDPSTPSDKGTAARVNLPSVGERFTVTIPPPTNGETLGDVTTCFDNTEVMPTTDDKTASSGVFSMVVPSVANITSGMVPLGDHALHVRWSYVGKDGKKRAVADRHDFLLKPILEQVHVAPPSDNNPSDKNPLLSVVLRGHGFDKSNATKYLVIVNGQPRDVCWPGATGCLSPPAIKGTISGPYTIGLDNVDLSERAPSQFQVCYGDESSAHCSNVMTDGTNASDHTRIVLLSLGVLVVIAGGIVLLVVLSRSLLVLWGERYVLSVLLLDKETDTFSLSKLQFYVWTAAAIFGYSYLTLSRFLVQHWHELPSMPSGLPGIVGIAAGTAVGAQVVTQINGPKGAGKLRPSLSDLITTGDVVAAERVQYLVWTIVGAIGFSLAIAYLDPRSILNLPDVPPSILAISGISAFGYLGGKLARNAGPVINEAIVTIGPDPDVIAPGAQAAPASTPTPAWLQRIQTAVSAINDATRRLGGVTPTDGISSVLTPTKAAADAAASALAQAAKLTVSSTAADLAAAKVAVDRQVTDSAKGADDAAKALAVMGPAKSAATDFATATSIAKIAQDAAKAVQDIQAALLTAAPGAPTADSSTKFGLLELRGRMLSQDATFKISLKPDSAADDFQLAFDRLQPSPKDDKHVQKPRVIEGDPDAGGDSTLAKRLLLVVILSDQTRDFFREGSTHTLTVTNPDSQKVVFKYDVPETQKPS
jgi:hypothetical protein